MVRVHNEDGQALVFGVDNESGELIIQYVEGLIEPTKFKLTREERKVLAQHIL